MVLIKIMRRVLEGCQRVGNSEELSLLWWQRWFEECEKKLSCMLGRLYEATY